MLRRNLTSFWWGASNAYQRVYRANYCQSKLWLSTWKIGQCWFCRQWNIKNWIIFQKFLQKCGSDERYIRSRITNRKICGNHRQIYKSSKSLKSKKNKLRLERRIMSTNPLLGTWCDQKFNYPYHSKCTRKWVKSLPFRGKIKIVINRITIICVWINKLLSCTILE